jgi:hypothetical protein
MLGCSETEEFYYRKRERDCLLYQMRESSTCQRKKKEKRPMSFLCHHKLGGGKRLHVITSFPDL